MTLSLAERRARLEHELARKEARAAVVAADIAALRARLAMIDAYDGPMEPDGRPPRKLSKNAEEMLELRRAGQTLEQIGQRFGVTRERVRQIIKRTGEKFPPQQARGPRPERRVERVPWRCADCGEERLVLPSSPRGKLCLKCNSARRRTITDDVVELAKKMLEDGETYTAIQTATGQHYQSVAHYIWRHSTPEDRARIFAGRRVAWMESRG